jgi:hypothetical protein
LGCPNLRRQYGIPFFGLLIPWHDTPDTSRGRM